MPENATPKYPMKFEPAADIARELKRLTRKLNLTHLNPKRIIAFRSFGSKSRARARIWAFPKIWQLALKLPAYYCIEVLSEKFDHLNERQRRQVLVHELLHIPKNFSGAVLPHTRRWHSRLREILNAL